MIANCNGFNAFSGILDDAAFYNKALTLEQVQSHHATAIRLAVRRAADNIKLSWPYGTLQEASSVNGSFTDLPAATSPYTNSIGAADKFYRVKMQ